MKKLIKKRLPFIYNLLVKIKLKLTTHSKKIYSQFGEDAVLLSYIGDKKNGFYIDVGAYHPHRFSNTYLFYKKGWSGINIDAKPGSMKDFKKTRKRDINIGKGVSNKTTVLDYYMYTEPAYNTFSKEKYKNLKEKNITPFKITKVDVDKLENILKNNLLLKQEIDFMSIDVEGHTIEVLESNNWNIYRPRYILVETHGFNKEDEVNLFLEKNDYKIVSIANITSIYKNIRQ